MICSNTLLLPHKDTILNRYTYLIGIQTHPKFPVLPALPVRPCRPCRTQKKEPPRRITLQDGSTQRRRPPTLPHRIAVPSAPYSPASHRSTIGAGGLNFSVRNGKRWNPAAITTMCSFGKARTSRAPVCRTWAHKRATRRTCRRRTAETRAEGKEFGQLVALGFAVAGFAPAPYRRPRLGRPSKRSSHLADGFALRCLQRLS